MRDEMGKRAMMRAGAESVWSGCAGIAAGRGCVGMAVWRFIYSHGYIR